MSTQYYKAVIEIICSDGHYARLSVELQNKEGGTLRTCWFNKDDIEQDYEEAIQWARKHSCLVQLSPCFKEELARVTGGQYFVNAAFRILRNKQSAQQV